MSISSTLINWYLQKKRNLPWRNTDNPYQIWISEVILQQTRVIQGQGYYERFLTAFPTIESLAGSDLEEVLKVWQGLGYYTRARNLHTGAKYVVQQLDGIIPAKYEELKKIKGVGDYTAAAIASFAFNLPVSVVDGNVNRVIARLFGIHDPINSTSGIKQIKTIARKLLDIENPGTHNQAIMEFGALQCTVRNPGCGSCPLQNECVAHKRNEVNILPVKIKNQKIRDRYFNYLVIVYNNMVYFKKRDNKDIWHGLYEFPLIETENKVQEKDLIKSEGWNSVFRDQPWSILQVSKEFKHQLSHQTIHAIFYVVRIDYKTDKPVGELINWGNIYQYPVSKLVENFISKVDLSNI
jgi:A/G-specific adenine glycosylase